MKRLSIILLVLILSLTGYRQPNGKPYAGKDLTLIWEKVQADQPLSSRECRFCHLEAATREVAEAIGKKAFIFWRCRDVSITRPTCFFKRGKGAFRRLCRVSARDRQIIMNTPYQPIQTSFHEELETLIRQRKYVGLLYLTPLRELLSTTAILKELYAREEARYLLLNTGEEVRLDRLVSANGRQAPGYDYDDFTRDC